MGPRADQREPATAGAGCAPMIARPADPSCVTVVMPDPRRTAQSSPPWPPSSPEPEPDPESEPEPDPESEPEPDPELSPEPSWPEVPPWSSVAPADPEPELSSAPS